MTNPITTLAHWLHGLTAWLVPADLHDVEEDNE